MASNKLNPNPVYMRKRVKCKRCQVKMEVTIGYKGQGQWKGVIYCPPCLDRRIAEVKAETAEDDNRHLGPYFSRSSSRSISTLPT